jgi:hypothetical protein
VKVIAVVIGVIGVLAFAASDWIYSTTSRSPIHGDGKGYYVYLPALFLDHDLTLQQTAYRSFGGTPGNIPGVSWERTAVPAGQPHQHGWVDHFGVGEAVMIAPFFAVGDIVAKETGQPQDGFSSPYQWAASTAGTVYMLLGLALTAGFLKRWFSRRTVVATLIAITFGAAVFEYGSYETTLSHAYSFCVVALVVWLALRVWERPRILGVAALGAALGLLTLVRATNLMLLVFCVLVGVERREDLLRRARSLRGRVDLVAVGVGVFLVVLIPQSAYWYRITSALVFDPYGQQGQYLDLLHPHLEGVLFSVRKGLFFWTPLLILAVAGLPLLRRTARPVFAAAVAYLAVAVWVVSSWSSWPYGFSFGMRALIDEMPVFALGLAALIETVRGAFARRLLLAAIVLTTLIAVQGMYAYWFHLIPGDGTTLDQRLESFEHWPR